MFRPLNISSYNRIDNEFLASKLPIRFWLSRFLGRLNIIQIRQDPSLPAQLVRVFAYVGVD